VHAVILAGGKGTRLRPYTTCIPKPLVPVGEHYSILEIVMRQLTRCGFRNVTVALGHLGHLIRAYCGDGSQWGLAIDYAVEESPLSTIGPLLTILDRLPSDFLVLNGDILTDLDFADVLNRHVAGGADMTVTTSQREVTVDFGVLSSRDGRIVDFSEKPTVRYRVSMGVNALNKAALTRYTPGLPLGFDELVLDLLAAGTPPAEYAFDGYWLDIGRPDDYERANREFDLLRPILLKAA
jgi:mannose-1-phosphate guanylyltransferase